MVGPAEFPRSPLPAANPTYYQVVHRDTTLLFCGVNSNTEWLSCGAISKPTPANHCEPQLMPEKWKGSRIQAVHGNKPNYI